MSYVAFVDMVGTRASALISNAEYANAINDFNNALKQVSDYCECKIYGYSDNAYIEINKLPDVVLFFRRLRDTLMYRHRYFTAAVDWGSLNENRVYLDDQKGFSMKFTTADTVDIYKRQSSFSGIGVSLSKKVVEELNKKGMQDCFRQSIFQHCPKSGAAIEVESVFDVSYDPVILDKLEYIMADYMIAAATSERAGRYYITPIITMIKCLDTTIFSDSLSKLITLLSFQGVPKSFQTLPHIKEYSLFFMFALIEFVLSWRQTDKTVDAKRICEQVISNYGIDNSELLKNLPNISTSIISNENKRHFLSILYNYEQISEGL